MLIAINFHYIREGYDAPFPAIYGTTPARFRRQLSELARLGEFVSAGDIEAAVTRPSALPAVALHVTFDDGFREQYERAWPILREMGIPALFFVSTRPVHDASVATVHKIHLLRSILSPPDFLELLHDRAEREGISLALPEDDDDARAQYRYDDRATAQLKYALNFLLHPRDQAALIARCFDQHFDDEPTVSRELYMSIEQIAELGSHGMVGTHSHDHLPLASLSLHDLRHQVGTSIRLITEWTGKSPFAASYPYGSRTACSREAASVLRQVGIRFAFTMERATNPDVTTHPLLLARFDNNDVPGGKKPVASVRSFLTEAPRASWFNGR